MPLEWRFNDISSQIGLTLLLSRTVATVALVGVGLFGLAACTTLPSPAPDETEIGAPDEAEETDEAAPDTAEGQPSWALPTTTGGDKIATIEVGGIVVEVYQVAVTQAGPRTVSSRPRTANR